mgnify:CR=1 FL=1
MHILRFRLREMLRFKEMWGGGFFLELGAAKYWSEEAAHAVLQTGCGLPARGVEAAGAVCPLQARVPHFWHNFSQVGPEFCARFCA